MRRWGLLRVDKAKITAESNLDGSWLWDCCTIW
jgi:hypothetical protein